MTKREIIYRVLERVRAMSDDSDITEELISSMIDTKRAIILKQQYSKASWNIPIELQQEICISLESVDTIDGFKGAGQTIRTAESIPDPIKIKGNMGPLMVRREDGSVIPINVIPIERLPYIGNNRYTAMLTYAAMDFNRRLILVSKDNKLKFLKKLELLMYFRILSKLMKWSAEIIGMVQLSHGI